MRRFLGFAVFALSASAASAAPLPLGLDDLHWGMTREQAAAASAFFGQAPPPPPGVGKSLRVRIPGYVWHDCKLVVTFDFGAAGLQALDLVQSASTQSCRDDVTAAMTAQYGTPATEDKMGFSFYTWPGDADTIPKLGLVDKGLVSANGYGVHVELHRKPAAP